MGMSIESLRDLDVNKKVIDRRAFIQALTIGALAACTPSSSSESPQKAKEVSGYPDVPATEVPPTPEIITKDINFTSSILKSVYPDEISAAEWADIGAGKNIPFPFGTDQLPILAMSIDRVIDAENKSFYGKWVGNRLVEHELGYRIKSGAILHAYMKCAVFIYPPYSPGNPYYDGTTRMELLSTEGKTSNVFVLGGVIGKDIELLADVPVYRVKPAIILEAGEPICKITRPTFIPSSRHYLVDVKYDFPNNLHVRQSNHPSSAVNREDFYQVMPNGEIVGSEMSTKSFRKTADGKFVALNSPAGK